MNDTELKNKYEHLKNEWQKATCFMSNTSDMIADPNYQEIIKMGMSVVPFIINDFKSIKKTDHLFGALNEITGENPVKPSSQGYVYKMARDWLDWAWDNLERKHEIKRYYILLQEDSTIDNDYIMFNSLRCTDFMMLDTETVAKYIDPEYVMWFDTIDEVKAFCQEKGIDWLKVHDKNVEGGEDVTPYNLVFIATFSNISDYKYNFRVV